MEITKEHLENRIKYYRKGEFHEVNYPREWVIDELKKLLKILESPAESFICSERA